MSGEEGAKALVVYYTFSRQTGRVAEVVAKTLGDRDYGVTMSAIEFTDPHWAERFSKIPMRWAVVKIGSILVAQRLRRTGEIGIPEEAQSGDYDLVVIGSPTWWLTTNMPVRSYLKSPVAEAVLGGKPFAAFSVSRRYWKGNMKDVRRLDPRWPEVPNATCSSTFSGSGSRV